MIVYTGGTFDILHAGHIEFLERCWLLSAMDRVVVALNTDDFVASYKGHVPVMPYGQRMRMLLGCRFVSEVVQNIGGEDSRPAIESVRPDIVAIGSDWHDRDYLAQMQFDWEWLHSRDIVLAYIPRVIDISTTNIKKRILGE